jgi:DNA-binding MarR family transcriptional regulator
MDILHYLFKNNEKEITQRELEVHFSIKHSTVIGILGRMEKNGFIKISVCENDRRQRKVELLDKAFDVRAECKLSHEYIENKFKENFSREELECFTKLLDKTYDILKGDTEND